MTAMVASFGDLHFSWDGADRPNDLYSHDLFWAYSFSPLLLRTLLKLRIAPGQTQKHRSTSDLLAFSAVLNSIFQTKLWERPKSPNLRGHGLPSRGCPGHRANR